MPTGLQDIINFNANFLPYETIPVTASSSSSSAAFTLAQSLVNDSVMIANVGSVTAFVAFGVGSATAQLPAAGHNNATPIPPGAIMVLKKNLGGKQADTCAAITSSGSAQLYFTSGEGS